MSESKTSERRLEAHRKRLAALALRYQGKSFESIAQTIGFSRTMAYKAVMTAIRETEQEPADDVRRMELDRIDAMLVGLWPLVAPPEFDPSDPRYILNLVDPELRIKAVASVTKLMERRAKYLNLDAPSKVELTGKDGGPIKSESPGMTGSDATLLLAAIAAERARREAESLDDSPEV